ncbi:hypothetical protein HDU93_002176, partial [Gonapodya sp. JEL0774]
RWHSMVSTPTSSKPEVAAAASELSRTLAIIDEDIAELRDAVRASEADPKRFRLDVREVSSRKQFVERAASRVREMRSQIASASAGVGAGAFGPTGARREPTLKGKPTPSQEMKSVSFTSNSSNPNPDSTSSATVRSRAQPSSKPSATPRPAPSASPAVLPALSSPIDSAPSTNPWAPSSSKSSSYRPPGRAASPGRDPLSAGPEDGLPPADFYENEVQTQQMLLRTQDDQLSSVLSTVTNLKQIAVTMGDEVDDQRRLLDDLDTSVDNTGGRLGMAMKRVQKVLEETRNDKSMMTIGCLIVVLIVLLVLVIVT